ncbi:MAG: stage II sporulation protein M [Minisyncoccia bacterium]
MTIIEIKNYTNSLRPYIVFSIFLFIGSILAGYFIAHNYAKETEELLNEMKEMFLPAKEYSQLKIFMFIFENNVTVLSMSLLFSIMAGISSLLVITANGIILGVFAVIILENLSAEYFMAGILPHGIFEIPALILTSAVGFRIGAASLSKLFAGRSGLLSEIANGFRFFILIIVPLIFIAALTEAFVTPIFLSFFNE